MVFAKLVHLHCHSLPIPPPSGRQLERIGGTKGKDYRLRKIYWQQQWDKKTNDSSDNTNDRGYKKGNESRGEQKKNQKTH